MRRRSRFRLTPQHEFGFAPDAFNLVIELTLDGERLTREHAVADEARTRAESGQSWLFPIAGEVAHD
jgi:hypothetical protein